MPVARREASRRSVPGRGRDAVRAIHGGFRKAVLRPSPSKCCRGAILVVTFPTSRLRIDQPDASPATTKDPHFDDASRRCRARLGCVPEGIGSQRDLPGERHGDLVSARARAARRSARGKARAGGPCCPQDELVGASAGRFEAGGRASPNSARPSTVVRCGHPLHLLVADPPATRAIGGLRPGRHWYRRAH